MTLKKFALYHLPAIIYGMGIIIVSSVPNLNTPKVTFIAFDKVIHFFEYGLFSFLIYRSFSSLFADARPSRVFLLSLLFLTLFALADEIHQKYIPGRFADPYDLIFDMIGSVLILVLLWLRHSKTTPEG